jgi:hypothetical protein
MSIAGRLSEICRESDLAGHASETGQGLPEHIAHAPARIDATGQRAQQSTDATPGECIVDECGQATSIRQCPQGETQPILRKDEHPGVSHGLPCLAARRFSIDDALVDFQVQAEERSKQADA